jgi:hypothetical protein
MGVNDGSRPLRVGRNLKAPTPAARVPFSVALGARGQERAAP